MIKVHGLVESLWEDRKRRMDVLKAPVRSSLGTLQEPVVGLGPREAAETLASPTWEAYVVEVMYVFSCVTHGLRPLLQTS